MSTILAISNQEAQINKKELRHSSLKQDENAIFTTEKKNNNLNEPVSFFSEDWSASMARKAGWDKFADWIDNKEALENPEKSKDESFVSKALREMVKHPVLTIATVATVVFCGTKLYKHFNKATQAVATPPAVVDDVVKVTQPPKVIVEAPKELANTPENVKMLTEKINAGLAYEKEIGYSNLEILKDLAPEDRKKIVNYFNYHFEDSKNFVAFASGEAPATLQCVNGNRTDLFDCLRSDKIAVSEFFWDKGGDLVMNKEKVSKIIGENLELFKNRLGLPAEATIKDVEKLIYSMSFSPLKAKNKYDDLIQLVIGNDLYDACHAQIIKDIRGLDMFFYPGKANSLTEYKEILKQSVMGKYSSYRTMSQEFKDDLLRMIDNIPQESFNKIIAEPVEVMRYAKSEDEKFKALVRLAEKLEQAQKNGTMIKMS